MIMEEDITSQKKPVRKSVGRKCPFFCKCRYNIQLTVDFSKRTVQLMYGPHHRLAFGICRIQGPDAFGLIVIKSICPRIALFSASGKRMNKKNNNKANRS